MPSQKQLYSFATEWPVYGLNWCQRPGTFRLGMGSFVPEHTNKISIIEVQDRDDDFMKIAEVEQPFPCTKLLWAPYKAANSPDLFATTGEFLKIWELAPGSESTTREEGGSSSSKIGRRPSQPRASIAPIAVLKNQRRTNSTGHAPITSMDWNETDPNIVITSSIDTTCTVWDVSTQQAKTQLIAHDREVFDVAFSQGNQVFASVGADGSLRMFDLRNLEHSTILYECGPVPDEARVPPSSAHSDSAHDVLLPLLRLSWNKQDPNYIATFQTDSSAVLIMDIRVPAIPVLELRGHGSVITALGWAPHSSSHICSTGDDAQALVWDISKEPKDKYLREPVLAYSADAAINQMAWSAPSPDWVAISFDQTVQALRV